MIPQDRPKSLAIFGGPAAFREPVHVGRPNIGDRNRILARINDMLDRRWLTNGGPFVQEFERRVAETVNVRHCIAVCNATIALQVAVRALGLGGEVIVPAFTFVATAHALEWQEITPIFCDIHPRTFCIDPERVEALITPRTSGIVGVHLWGRPCDVVALADIAHRHHLQLLFDAAHAFGCSCAGQMIGNFGQAEVFSFHATKFLNSFEGGAVVTNDDELARKIRLMINFGFAGYDNVICLGTNGKMTEAAAAMGLTSLESMGTFVERNHHNYRAYRQVLLDLPGITMLIYDETERQNYQYIVIRVDESRAGLSRDMLLQVLHSENVLARRYFYPGCHSSEPYRSRNSYAKLPLAITEELSQEVLQLPTGTTIREEDVYLIGELVRLALRNAESVRTHLSRSGYGSFS